MPVLNDNSFNIYTIVSLDFSSEEETFLDPTFKGRHHSIYALHPKGSHSHAFLLSGLLQFSSVPQLCLTLCNPMNCSMSHVPVYHQFPEFIQTHVRRVGVAIQPSHPLSSPSPPAPNPSQHQSLFQ